LKLRVLCNLLIVLLAASQLQAVPVFSTFGPGDSIGGGGYYIGYLYALGSEIDSGGQFAITVGTPHTLDSIELAAYLDAGINEMDVWLMSDATGEPGAIIEAFNFQNLPDDSLANKPLLVGNSALNPILTPGTNYWLVASAPNEHATLAVWSKPDPLVMGTAANRYGTGPWNVFNGEMMAFRINGSPIPAPGAILLAGLGAGLVGWMRRRRSL